MSGTWTDEILGLGGEPVFLGATVEFVGQSSFDESGIEELIHAGEPQAGVLHLDTVVEEGHVDGRTTVRVVGVDAEHQTLASRVCEVDHCIERGTRRRQVSLELQRLAFWFVDESGEEEGDFQAIFSMSGERSFQGRTVAFSRCWRAVPPWMSQGVIVWRVSLARQ